MSGEIIRGWLWFSVLAVLVGVAVAGGKLAAFCLSAAILWMLAGFIYHSASH